MRRYFMCTNGQCPQTVSESRQRPGALVDKLLSVCQTCGQPTITVGQKTYTAARICRIQYLEDGHPRGVA